MVVVGAAVVVVDAVVVVVVGFGLCVVEVERVPLARSLPAVVGVVVVGTVAGVTVVSVVVVSVVVVRSDRGCFSKPSIATWTCCGPPFDGLDAMTARTATNKMAAMAFKTATR